MLMQKMDKATKQLTEDMKHALEFATKFQGWHGYNARDTRTVKALTVLHQLGLIEEALTCYRLTPKTPQEAIDTDYKNDSEGLPIKDVQL